MGDDNFMVLLISSSLLSTYYILATVFGAPETLGEEIGQILPFMGRKVIK